MERCFMFQWGVCLSDEGSFTFKWGGVHPMAGASVLMGGFQKKLSDGGGPPMPPPPPHYGKPCIQAPLLLENNKLLSSLFSSAMFGEGNLVR